MIKSITVTNYLGDSIKIDLARPELSGFVVKSITGLGPGTSTINTTELITQDAVCLIRRESLAETLSSRWDSYGKTQ